MKGITLSSTVLALLVLETGCSATPRALERTAGDTAPPVAAIPAAVIPETVYVQLDGVGETPEGEFRAADEERYLEILTERLRASGVFTDTEVASPEMPGGSLIIDAHVDGAIDVADSWSNAALLMVVPVKTAGQVSVTFEVKRNGVVLARHAYDEDVVTYAVPAAELAGRTWIEKSGVLVRTADRFAAEFDPRAVAKTARLTRGPAGGSSDSGG